MNSGFDFDELKRELDGLDKKRAQEQLNVEVEQRELNQMHESAGVIQDLNRRIQSVINDQLFHVMGLSESNIAAQVLENLSKIETELAKLDVARDEQREATEKLNKEFQETLDVLEGVRNVDRHKDVKNKIEELENMALEREAEVQRLKVEKESVQKDIARFRMESGHEMEMLLKHYNELHAEMMKKKYATAEHSDDGNDE